MMKIDFPVLMKSALLVVQFHFPPGEDLSQVKEEIENTVKKVAENDDWLKINRPKISWISGVTGAEVDESSLFYQVVSSATKKITGKMPTPEDILNNRRSTLDNFNDGDFPKMGDMMMGGSGFQKTLRYLKKNGGSSKL